MIAPHDADRAELHPVPTPGLIAACVLVKAPFFLRRGVRPFIPPREPQ
jgi:hypothetical protein